MTPPCSNSFHSSGTGHPRGTLASMLRPLRATLRPNGSTWILKIAPMRPIDALTPWLNIDANLGARTLLLDSRMSESNAPASVSGSLGLGTEAVVLDDESLAGVLDRHTLEGRYLVRIAGLVEAADVNAIARGLKTGRSALQSELRAAASMRVEGDRCLHIETRDPDAASAFVAESFRQYVAVLRNRPVSLIAAPESWQIKHLLEIEGGLAVRPLETELYSTFIDIGVCVQADEPTRPAGCSLIYDVYGNSWHGEP